MTPEEPALFQLHEPEPPEPLHPWIRFLVSAVFVVIANYLALIPIFVLFSRHPLLADALYRSIVVAILIAGFFAFSRFVDRREDHVWTYIGLPGGQSSFRQFLTGVAIGGVLIAVGVAAIALLGGYSISAQLSATALRHELLVLVLLLAGAMAEEVAFRGYPFQRLVEAAGPWVAVAVMSAVFAAIHLGNPNAGGLMSWGFVNTILVGALFAYAYLRTRTLWLPFGMHFGWNFFLGVVFGLPVSGIRDFSILVRSSAHGPKLLTGGSYGLEASLTGAVVIGLGFLLVAWAPKPSPDVSQNMLQEPSSGI